MMTMMMMMMMMMMVAEAATATTRTMGLRECCLRILFPVFVIRDLKHQDGRWRRRRHIRIKAGARPASRSTRLSMLSNTATATSRQFSKRTTLLLRLQKLLVAYDDFWWL